MSDKTKLSSLIFIANRFNKTEKEDRAMSRPAVRIAIIGIALGLAVMLISIAIIVGFKKEVRNQIIGFGSHIQILSYDNYSTIEENPITVTAELEEEIRSAGNITDIQHIARKPGIIHSEEAFQGILLKGIDSTFNWDFFSKNLIEGEILNDSIKNGAVVSSAIAKTMNLAIGDNFITYFVTDKLYARKFKVTGIYQTTFSDYDKLYIITDIRHIQRLNKWEDNQYSSLEILLRDYNKIDETTSAIFDVLMNWGEKNDRLYRAETIETLTPQIFDWLGMLDINAVVILILMLAVSGFCVISGLLILILERTSTIGLFKSLGATNWEIRKIFLIQSIHLIGKGILWGNIIGLTIIITQYYFHLIPLDPTSYYVDYVPVSLTFTSWLLLNAGLTAAAIIMLIGPSYLVTRITPSEAMRKE